MEECGGVEVGGLIGGAADGKGLDDVGEGEKLCFGKLVELLACVLDVGVAVAEVGADADAGVGGWRVGGGCGGGQGVVCL